MMFAFGVIGYLFRKVDIPLAPIALTLVLGPQFEQSLRQSLVLSNGEMWIFLRSPISTTLIVVALASIAFSALRPASRAITGLKGQDSEV
jgi:putative tricarboxylic transport membrane protein